MTNERRQDVFLIALVVSVALHVALMVWIRPQVMTRVISVQRTPKRGPVTMREAPKMEAPKEIDFFKDESAKKEAPVAESQVAAPTADEALPMPSSDITLSAPDAPTLEAKVEMENLVSEIKPAPLPVVASTVKVSETVDSKPSFMSYAASDLVISVPAPVAPVPMVELTNTMVPRPLLQTSGPRQEHVVPEEVLATVDEKFVESEKEAVVQRFNVSDALDITKAVNVKLEKSVAGGWTYFRVTVTPKLNLPSVPKDVVVLMDASGSIGYDRLASCRKAARQILRTCTNTGDRFNLVAFRDRFSYAFRSWQECTAESFAKGDKWLTSLAAHGRTDVFATIRSVLTLPRDPKRPVIAMVVTDGEANSGVKETKEILSQFTSLNDGLISIYMYGVRKGANRELIDVLTHGNRGESYIYDSWKMWNAGDGIEGLSERFRDPVITDLRVVFAAPLRAVAYPVALKNLYRGNSVIITGRLPGSAKSVDFMLKGLAGDNVYEGFFQLPLATATADPKLAEAFAQESSLALQVR